MKCTNEREMVGKPRPLLCTPGTDRYSTNIHTAQAAGAATVTQITISQLLETMVTRDRSKVMPWFLPQLHRNILSMCTVQGSIPSAGNK